jgi:hypothetical protein
MSCYPSLSHCMRIAAAALICGAAMVSGQAACPTCLSVYSIQTYDYHGVGTLEALVKIFPLPSRSICVTEVSGQWTKPDGTTLVASASPSGATKRAKFSVSTVDQPTGTYKFNVLDVKCGTGYTYSARADSVAVTLSASPSATDMVGFVRAPPVDVVSTTRSPSPPPTNFPTINIPSVILIGGITLIPHNGVVQAIVRLADASGTKPQGVTVTAMWTHPDGTNSPIQSDIVDQWNMVMFREPVTDLGTYTFNIVDLDVTFDAAKSVMTDSIQVLVFPTANPQDVNATAAPA